MTQKKSKAAKIFIFITLIFIIFASFAVYIVMYAGVANTGNNPCEEGYVLNEETGECEEEITYTNEENINLKMKNLVQKHDEHGMKKIEFVFEQMKYKIWKRII